MKPATLEERVAALEREVAGLRQQLTNGTRPSGVLAQERPAENEAPEWLNVEKDVYVKVPFAGEILKDAVIIQGGPIRPCLIVPEGASDE